MLSSEDIDHLIDEELEDYADNHNGNEEDYTDYSDPAVVQNSEVARRATIPTADTAVNTLRKHFIHHNRCSIKRTQHGSAFTHCLMSVPIAEEYTKLRSLLEQHARLQLQKDVNNRIHQFEIFIRNLKKLVQEETASWLAINHSKDVELEEHQTNLTALSSICDEFRMHLNHWICVKQRAQNNRWVRATLPSIITELNKICTQFVRLQEIAFWWTEKLLKTGMQVFAYVDRRSLTYNDVFSIVRGIEEYNTLIQLVRYSTQEMKLSSHQHSISRGLKSRSNGFYLIQHCQHGAIDSSTTKSLHFLRLLHSLAFEWAKSAVAISRNFLDNQHELVEAMQAKRCEPVDEPPMVLTGSPPSMSRDRVKSGSPAVGTTSDYFSDSLNYRKSQGVNVDITCNASPLLDFGKKEKDYISKVIQITCQRTTLLRKNKFPGSSYPGASFAHSSPVSRKAQSKGDESVISEEPSETFTRQDPKRKSVSWGDTHDMSVCRQLLAKYTDALWKAYGTKLEDSLNYELQWSKPGGHKSNLGSLDFCSSGALMEFTKSVSHANSKGYFTTHGSQHFNQILLLLKARACFSSCDIAIAQCLAAMQTGKAEPIPLHNGQKSTKTAMFLRNAVLLLKSQLMGQPTLSEPLSMAKASPSHQYCMDYRVRAHAVSKIQLLIGLTEKWCIGKAKQFLHSYKVAPFVVITHGDLVILHKELLSAVQLIFGDMFTKQVELMRKQLDRLSLFHTEMKLQLSEKAKNLTLEIINQQMPRPRVWRATVNNVEPETEVQSYAETIVDSVLMPVSEGAKHLAADDQVAAIETVVNTICQVWSEYFLKKKIKFSIHGASQLDKDFSYLTNFIDVYLTDESVKVKIMESSGIHKFMKIIRILGKQSSSRKGSVSQSITQSNRVFPLENTSLDSGTERQAEGQPSNVTIENQSQWQALRAGRSICQCLP